ncbi:MAG: hypothetical protein AMXMBFR7_06640 [Planctomycetota bacterium]
MTRWRLPYWNVLAALAFVGACAGCAGAESTPAPEGPGGSVREIRILATQADDTPGEMVVAPPRAKVSGYHALDLSPDANRLAVAGNDGIIRFYNPSDGKPLGELKGHTGNVHGLSFSPEGKLLASASADGSIRIWDLAANASVQELKGHEGAVRCVAFGPTPDRLASSGSDGSIRLWDVKSGRCLRVFTGHGAGSDSVAFGRDGRTLLSEAGDVTARTWDAVFMREGIVLPERDGSVAALDLSPDARLGVTTRGDRTWRVFDTQSGLDVRILEGQDGNGSCARFTPDGRTLATGAQDGSLRLWDLPTGLERRRLRGSGGSVPKRLALDASGRWLATLDFDGACLIWDLWGPPARPKGHAELTLTAGTDALQDAWNRLRSFRNPLLRESAVWDLLVRGDDAANFIAAQLKPVAREPDPELVALIGRLDDERYAAREAAEAGLALRALDARPLLRQAAREHPSSEVRARAARVLATPAPEEILRQYAAVEILDWLNRPAATAHLEALAAGRPDHPLTTWAALVLERKKVRAQ